MYLGPRRQAGMEIELSDETEANPLDLMEEVASGYDCRVDRSGPRDLALGMEGHWCSYRVFLTWHPDVRALLYACAFELRVPENRRAEVAELLAIVNERLIIGHFDLWLDDGLVVFRHALMLRGISSASVEQLEDLMDISHNECERFYPAFHLVIWGGKDPVGAVEAAMLETCGEA